MQRIKFHEVDVKEWIKSKTKQINPKENKFPFDRKSSIPSFQTGATKVASKIFYLYLTNGVGNLNRDPFFS